MTWPRFPVHPASFLESSPVCRMPFGMQRVSNRLLRLLLSLALVATAVAATALPGVAQPITLPTVRVGGPTQEERAFFRLFQVVVSRLAPDTARLAADMMRLSRSTDSVVHDSLPAARQALARSYSLTRRFGPKLKYLVLGALSPDQRDRLDTTDWEPRHGLDSAARRETTLLALASDKYDTTDAPVRLLYDALVWYAASAPPTAPRHDRGRLLGRLQPPHVRERDPGSLMRGARELSELSAAQIADIDELTQLAVALIIFRKIEDRRGWLPVHDRPQAEIFWGQRGFAPLNVGAVAVVKRHRDLTP